MANGLELRAPFLDVDFAEFCLSLPSRLKINRYQDKLILRQAMAEQWPEAIRQRRKQGFGSPVGAWLKQPGFVRLKERLLADKKSRLYELLDFEACRGYIGKNNYQTWILLNLAAWLEAHPQAVVSSRKGSGGVS
jgi:asparagine synthase (glutamine-hydrolysing)